MKNLPIISLALMTLAASAESEPDSKPQFRNAATHEQLVLALRKADARNPMKKLEPVVTEDPSKVNQPVDLFEQSDIISFRGLATLVPKRAIISAPSNHKERLTLQPGSKIVGWAEFYALNRGWITTVEVSRRQAEGNSEIAEETRNYIAESRNLVVATMKGGPISVFPPKKPEAAEENETTSQNTEK